MQDIAILNYDSGVGGCPGFPCYNGGSCYTDDSGSRCLCPDAAPGRHCEGNCLVHVLVQLKYLN